MAVAGAVVGGEGRASPRGERRQEPSGRPRALDDAAEPDEGDLRRVDHAVDRRDALLAEAGDGDRRVGSSRELRSAARARLHQVAQSRHQLVEISSSRRRGSPGRPARRRAATIATPRWTRLGRVERVPVSRSRSAPAPRARRERRGLQEQHGGEEPLGDGPAAFALLEPGERRSQVDVGARGSSAGSRASSAPCAAAIAARIAALPLVAGAACGRSIRRCGAAGRRLSHGRRRWRAPSAARSTSRVADRAARPVPWRPAESTPSCLRGPPGQGRDAEAAGRAGQEPPPGTAAREPPRGGGSSGLRRGGARLAPPAAGATARAWARPRPCPAR